MKSACLDVIGTCFGFDQVIQEIQQRLGPSLEKANANAQILFFSWFYTGQRDFTYTSILGSYTPIASVLNHTFKRACIVVGIPADQVTHEDTEAIMKAMKKLQPRPGLKSYIDGLRSSGWDVFGVTNGGKETTLDYYKLANIELDADHVLSCDQISVAKPNIKVYTTANERLTARGFGQENDGNRWFVAAHAWDLLAARKAGFRTAYLTFEEGDPVETVFGKFDIYADTFEELLEKMKRA